MIKPSLIIASLAACFTYVSAGDIIASRSFPSCNYVGEKIYCFGGDTSPLFNVKPKLDEDVYSLDINAFSGQRSEIMISQWNKWVPEVRFWVGQRRTPTAVVLADGKRFMIQGGNNTAGSFKYLNQTAIYDTSTKLWAKGTPYTVESAGGKQIYSSTAVNLPNGLIGFYGGFEQFANIDVPEIAGNGNKVTFDRKNTSYTGFTRFITHNAVSGTWAPFSPQGNTLLDFYPTSQTATIDPSTGKIYYLGGTYYTTTSNWAPIKIPFSWAAIFDTKSGSWSNETMNGNIPSTRMHHTANLLPNSQDIILYGGSEDSEKASNSYCYTLNLEDNAWTKHDTVNVPDYLSGPRFSHAAVLVDTTLFILFGRGADGSLSPSLVTLNVADASNIAYTTHYVANAATNLNDFDSNDSDSNDSDSDESDGLSKGAIGGIAAGAVVAGLGIIAFVFFYLRRQKKTKKQDTPTPMAVDWDKIDGHYNELPTSKPNYPGSPEVGSNDGYCYSPNLTEATAVDNHDFYYSPNMNHGNLVNVVKPSVMEDHSIIVKPDQK